MPECCVRCTYAFLIGVTGVASFVNWKAGWEHGNVGIRHMSDDPAALWQAIVESIQHGRPVIAFGPTGVHAYVANDKTDDASIIDAHALKEVGRMDVGTYPSNRPPLRSV